MKRGIFATMPMNVRRIQQPGPDFMPSLAKRRGRGGVIGKPHEKIDRSSLVAIIAMTAIVFVMLAAVSGLWTFVWLLAGPMVATLALAIGRMGGPVWARITAAAYTGTLLVGLGLVIAGS